jgi:hypothetical protein
MVNLVQQYGRLLRIPGRLWLELAGQGGRQWLREALTQPDIPSAVRSGAAACLGDVSDSPTYDQLCQAGLSPQGGNSRQEALDLLALFLHHSPKKFEVPGPLRKEVFLRLARLQRQAGAWERRHRVRVARAAALAGVVALFGIDMLWGDFLSMLVGTGAIFGVLSFLAFVLAGQMLAFIFAEVMTSLEWILQRSAAIVKILALGAAGIAAGAPRERCA